MTHPKFLLDARTQPIQRLYHGRVIMLWEGHVRLKDVRGWASNPRVEMEMKKWKSDFAGAEIDQSSLYDMMKKTKHVKLKRLADNIRDNGVREPIVLTFDSELLDGNRRFFATKFAHESAKGAAEKDRLEKIPAFVMMEDATDEDKQHILVEENFSQSLKEEWPPYVKAKKIHEAHHDEGLSRQEICQKFGWNLNQVRTALRTWEIVDAFIDYASETPDMESGRGGLGLFYLEAEKIASDHYQFLNEAQKSFYGSLVGKDYDSDFSELFYRLIAQGNFFSRFDDVRVARDAFNDEVGRGTMEKGEVEGGKDIRALIQMKKSRIEKEKSVRETIAEFVQFLKKLSAEDIRDISDDSFRDLGESLTLIQKLVQTVKGKK